MRCAVRAHQSAPVNREHHRQVLQGDVVNQLVVGALQKGRVDGYHWPHAFAGKSAGEGHRMLLGDADVEVALGKFGGEAHHA